MAGLAFEQAEQGEGNAHGAELYTERIHRGKTESVPTGALRGAAATVPAGREVGCAAGRGQGAWALALCCAASFVSTLDSSIMFVAFPSIRASFPGVSTGQLSWIVTGYTIVGAALLVPAGRLSDRRGRRRTFLGGVALFALGSLLCGLAPTAVTLIAARVVQALGSALLTPASLALIVDAFPTRRATAVGTWGATSGAGAALGPSLGACR